MRTRTAQTHIGRGAPRRGGLRPVALDVAERLPLDLHEGLAAAVDAQDDGIQAFAAERARAGSVHPVDEGAGPVAVLRRPAEAAESMRAFGDEGAAGVGAIESEAWREE